MSNQSDYSKLVDWLSNPKQKLSGSLRRRAKRALAGYWTELGEIQAKERGTHVARQQPKDGMLRLTEALAKRSARRLVRFIKQSARRASTAKHLLAKMSPDSKFRPPVEETQKFNIIAFVAATTELENRGKVS